jgi:hypothetical protein
MNAALATHPVDGTVIQSLGAELITYEDYGAGGVTATTGTNGPIGTTTAATAAGVPPPGGGGAGSCPGPYASVRTTLIARIPAPIVFFSANFNTQATSQQGVGNGLIKFQSLYTYPITNTAGPLAWPVQAVPVPAAQVLLVVPVQAPALPTTSPAAQAPVLQALLVLVVLSVL